MMMFSVEAEREAKHPNRETKEHLHPALSVYPRGYVSPDSVGCFTWKRNTMNTTTETSNTTSTGERPITFSDEPNAVTIRISGKAFANLKEITAIFNKWDEADNTPADIARRFMCDGDEWRWLDEKKPDATFLPQTICGLICDCFSECGDMPELEKAFEAAGFSVQR